ncbi:hypothetical protein FHS96_005699 [Sphingomonas zeicaulis]
MPSGQRKGANENGRLRGKRPSVRPVETDRDQSAAVFIFSTVTEMRLEIG